MKSNRTAQNLIDHSDSSSLDKLGFLTLISIGIAGTSLLASIIVLFTCFGIANKPMPALVQLATGKTIRVATMDETERTPAILKDFVSLTMTRMMTWNGSLPAETADDLNNPKLDPGVPVPVAGNQSLKVPTIAWRGSFALSKDFQNPFLQELAKLATKIQSGRQSVTRLEVHNIGEPILVQKGAWRIPIISTITILKQGDSLPTRIQFNKDVYVKAVPVPAILEGGKPGVKDLSQLVAEGKAAGLEIYLITEPKTVEIKPGAQSEPIVTPAK